MRSLHFCIVHRNPNQAEYIEYTVPKDKMAANTIRSPSLLDSMDTTKGQSIIREKKTSVSKSIVLGFILIVFEVGFFSCFFICSCVKAPNSENITVTTGEEEGIKNAP